MKVSTLTFLLFAFCTPAFGECYVIDKWKGQSVRESTGLDFFEDKYSSRIEIRLAGDDSKVDSQSCTEVKRNFLLCTVDAKAYIVETWHIMPIEKKAIWTKSRYMASNQMNGASILIGDIVGKCE